MFGGVLRGICIVVCLASALLVPSMTAAAGSLELTPLVGASFDTSDSGNVVPSYGVVFGFPRGPGTGLELLLIRQRADAKVEDPEGSGDVYAADADVDHLHFGGIYIGGRPEKKSRGFVSFSMGLTRLDAPSGFGDEYSFSFAVGGGLQVRLGNRTRLRFQASWFSRNAGPAGVSCRTGSCRIVSDSFIGGIEFSTGLTIGF
jgi:hypothetical protein